MKVLVTGSDGFIGKNLCFALRERGYEVLEFTRTKGDLKELTKECNFVFHLAGVNRPIDNDFSINASLTKELLIDLMTNNNLVPVVFSSSTQVGNGTPYGNSKLICEELLKIYQNTCDETYIFRIANVFGRGCRPNYNSVIATWCYNLSHNIECRIDDPSKELEVIYIDDLIKAFISILEEGYVDALQTYRTTLGDIYSQLLAIRDSVNNCNMVSDDNPFIKDLYSTYLYYLPHTTINRTKHSDDRGSFTELLKSNSFGQVSVNIIKPGITKGGHYHFNKWEQFIVVKGVCEIEETNIFTNEKELYRVDDTNIDSVYMKPGFLHSIKNIGNEDAVVIIYANENYDPDNPDTHTFKSST